MPEKEIQTHKPEIHSARKPEFLFFFGANFQTKIRHFLKNYSYLMTRSSRQVHLTADFCFARQWREI